MSEMLDKMAKEIFRASPGGWNVSDGEAKQHARMALYVLREPTREVLKAGIIGAMCLPHATPKAWEAVAGAIWQAMIDSALAEGETK